MEKVSPRSLALAFAVSLAGIRGVPFMEDSTPAKIMHKKRGKAPTGKRWKSTSVYFPAGIHRNVPDSRVKNPKIRAHVQMMYEKWLAAKTSREHKEIACV